MKRSDDDGKPKGRYIQVHEMAPEDMAGKQPGAYKYLAKVAHEMSVDYRLKRKSAPTKAQFFKELFYRSGVSDPRRKK